MTIAGAGLAGALLAVYLGRRGFQVEMFERAPDPRGEQESGGRSINLALAERGLAALREVGLHHRVARISLPMRGRFVHPEDAEPFVAPYGRSAEEVIYSVHRRQLNQTLLDAAEATRRVRLHFNQELLELDVENGIGQFRDHASGRDYERAIAPLIGADGVNSVVRRAIDRHQGTHTDIQLLDHGYRELTLPGDASGQHRLDPAALHIWPRGEFMLIALPNLDGSFTATLFLAAEGDDSLHSLSQPADFKAFMQQHFTDVMPLLTELDTDLANNPVGVMGTIRCPQWHAAGTAVVLGDAAHAVVPFHGQGMNCAFEDCIELDQTIAASDTWAQAFARFQSKRLANANAIADMALENYLEMRSAVVDPAYQFRRQLERELERRFPGRFIPRYSLVMFRRLPYVQAQRRGRVNLEILMQLTRTASRLDDVDFAEAEQLIVSRLPPLEAAT